MKNKEIKQELNKLTISSPGICPKETALLISHLLAQQEKRLSKEMTGAILMSKQGWCEQGRADLLKEFREKWEDDTQCGGYIEELVSDVRKALKANQQDLLKELNKIEIPYGCLQVKEQLEKFKQLLK